MLGMKENQKVMYVYIYNVYGNKLQGFTVDVSLLTIHFTLMTFYAFRKPKQVKSVLVRRVDCTR